MVDNKNLFLTREDLKGVICEYIFTVWLFPKGFTQSEITCTYDCLPIMQISARN